MSGSEEKAGDSSVGTGKELPGKELPGEELPGEELTGEELGNDNAIPFGTPMAEEGPDEKLARRGAWASDGDQVKAKKGRPRKAEVLERQKIDGIMPLIEMWKRKWLSDKEYAPGSDNSDTDECEKKDRGAPLKIRRIGKSPEAPMDKEKDEGKKEGENLAELIKGMKDQLSREIQGVQKRSERPRSDDDKRDGKDEKKRWTKEKVDGKGRKSKSEQKQDRKLEDWRKE